MVLRGQPVGEQGAADRWTALDPYIAGSGAGAPRGHPLRGAPFLFSPHMSSRGPPGPFSMPPEYGAGDLVQKGAACNEEGPDGAFLLLKSPRPIIYSAPSDFSAPRLKRGPYGSLSLRGLNPGA